MTRPSGPFTTRGPLNGYHECFHKPPVQTLQRGIASVNVPDAVFGPLHVRTALRCRWLSSFGATRFIGQPLVQGLNRVILLGPPDVQCGRDAYGGVAAHKDG